MLFWIFVILAVVSLVLGILDDSAWYTGVVGNICAVIFVIALIVLIIMGFVLMCNHIGYSVAWTAWLELVSITKS